MKRLGWILLGFFGCIVLIYLVRRSAKAEVIEEERGITLTQQAFMPLEERTPTIRGYEPISTPTPIIPISSTSPQDVYASIPSPTPSPTETLIRHGIYQRTTISVPSAPTVQELIRHGGIRK